jgi:hypothetical protein
MRSAQAYKLFLFSVMVVCFSCGQPAQAPRIDATQTFKSEPPTQRPNWERPRNLLTVDQVTFTRLIASRGWGKGRWYLLLVSLGCGDCHAALRALNRWAESGKQCVAVGHEMETPHLTETLERQIAGYGLRFPVEILSSPEYRRTGAMIVPTLVVIKDGIWVKAMDVSLGFPPLESSESTID